MRLSVPHHPAQWTGDARHYDFCTYCGGRPQTRDHVPSKILLDDPLPQEPPYVPACRRCNRSFSEDEQYVACLVEVAQVGDVDDSRISREKILPLLDHEPSDPKRQPLRRRLASARRIDHDGNVSWDVDVDAVRRVVLKLARGHALWELDARESKSPAHVTVRPLATMTVAERTSFEQLPAISVFPEVGSRALTHCVAPLAGPGLARAPWVAVQPGRYRFLAAPTRGTLIRIVLSEYLACEVQWTG